MIDNIEIYSETDYESGIQLLNEMVEGDVQIGGADYYSKVSNILGKVLNPSSKSTINRVIKGAIRTGIGVPATIATAGAGGDVATSSIFAIQSSISFMSDAQKLVKIMQEMKSLFNELFIFRHHKSKFKLPIISRLILDDGLTSFEKHFEKILINHINKYGTHGLQKMHDHISKILNKITTVVSDWIACLFPDTAGIAGEVSKTVLDFVVKHGFTYMYNLISFLPDRMQRMITNPFAMKKLVKDAITFLKKVIRGLKESDIKKIIASIGNTAGKVTHSSLVKNAIQIGLKNANSAASSYVGKMPGIFSNSSLSPQTLLIKLIDKYIVPNISFGVELFYQLFPIFLMFLLFVEKFEIIAKQIHKKHQ